MQRFVRITFLSAVLTLLVGTQVYAQTQAAPTLSVIAPSEGQTIYGNKVPVLISVENFQISDFKTNLRPVAGLGHIHLWLDDNKPTRESAVKLTSNSFTYQDLAYGKHQLVAELVGNDHISQTPKITKIINFTTEPIATPTPPPTTGFDKATALVILIVVAIIIIAAWWYTKEEEETPKATTRKSTKKASRRRRK